MNLKNSTKTQKNLRCTWLCIRIWISQTRFRYLLMYKVWSIQQIKWLVLHILIAPSIRNQVEKQPGENKDIMPFKLKRKKNSKAWRRNLHFSTYSTSSIWDSLTTKRVLKRQESSCGDVRGLFSQREFLNSLMFSIDLTK